MSYDQFNDVLQNIREEMHSLHANRPTPALVENVSVNAYNSAMRLQELASISTPEPQLLLIQPWDSSLVKAIETALRENERKFDPVVDGHAIRISFPPLTEEKRKELVKLMNEKVESARVAIRKVREDILKNIKEQEKNGEISEDDYFRQEKEVQQVVDKHNATIKEMADAKEKELMTV